MNKQWIFKHDDDWWLMIDDWWCKQASEPNLSYVQYRRYNLQYNNCHHDVQYNKVQYNTIQY